MLRSSIVSLGAAVLSSLCAHAQFSPVALTPESYNHDVVIELGGVKLPAPATTATLDQGTNNTAATVYERGFNQQAPDTGILPAGSLLISETAPDHTFQLASSYTAPNALLIDAGVTNGTLTVTTPTAASSLSFLASSGNGAAVLTYRVYHSDNTVETGTLNVPDWYNGANVALNLQGRVNAVTRTMDTVNANNPRLYNIDVALSDTTSPITKIEFERVSGGHVGLFAVAASSGAEFNPLAVSGFTYDMIVEATAEQRMMATTATVDSGNNNNNFTWYERGLNTTNLTSGVPEAGTLLTNAVAPDHVYRMAPSYKQANAILLDNVNSSAHVTPAAPASVSGLSFLGSSGGGAVTIGFVINHADGSTQVGSTVVPDWFNGTPNAYVVNGRINAVDGTFNAVGSNNPRLYSVDIVIDNRTSPVTSIDFNWTSGNGYAAIMAISATAGVVSPSFTSQPVSANGVEGGSATINAFISGTPPLTYRWQVGTNGVYSNIADGANYSGATTTNLTVNNLTLASAADYLLIGSNAGGSITSRVARVNIVSTKADVTTPSDLVASFNGSSPANEPVANVINDNTTKYLNYGLGTNQAPPFIGPVGFTVTLSSPAIVTGMRVYTANDAPDRDPIDFKLEGSLDGTTFTQVASGPLNLPFERNAADLGLDPMILANQEVRFANSGGFSTYRVTFTNVRNNTNANSVQVGEVELLGEFGAGAPSLSISRSGGTITVTSSQPGTLQSTTSLTPPITWNSEGAIDGSRTISATGTMKFFRVVQP